MPGRAINPVMSTISNVANLVNGIKNGDFGAILNSASQLALTYATGGTSAMFSQVASMVMDLATSQIGGGGSAGGLGGALGQTIGLDGASNMLANALTGAAGVEAGLGAIAMIGKEMGLPQAAIDAAQAVFAESQGDWRAERTNARQAGMGNSLDSRERAQANVFLDMIKGNANQQQQAPSILNTMAALIAGPNAGAVQLGQALGMTNAFQGVVNNLAFALFNQMMEEMRGGLLADANGNRQAGQGAAAQAGGAAGSAGNAASAPANGSIDLPVSSAASGNQSSGVASTGGGESILMKIAKALGAAMDDKMEKMAEKADALGKLQEVDEKNQSQYGEMSAELTALGQEL